MSIAEISASLQKEHNIFWKRQTINTFLSRLIKKQLVVQTGRVYTYIYTMEEYEQARAKDLLQKEYNGSLMNFVAALTGHQDLDEENYEALIQYLEKYN